ncbi:Zinc finger CCCH domain-containing protein [Paramyrothecium foliicola]|nr:Zinc finger CCCH domain-containing protein [Paramyrothecium foliicola]
MGDEGVSATSGAGQYDPKACDGVAGSDGIPSAGPDNQTAVPDIPSSQAQHQQPSLVPQGFSSQFDMIPSPPPTGRPGPYNMAPMVNALPQMGYRQNHYPQSVQQRYPSTASPSAMHQMPHMPQFPGPSMHMANQEYYVHPHHASPYYGTNQLPSTQAQQSMPPRPGMSYYPTPVMVNHPSTGYYYHHPPAAQYHGQPQPVHANMMAGQYMMGSPTSPSDPRVFGQSLGDNNSPLQRKGQNHNETDQRQNTVRGPPRKPRQSGHAIWIGNLPPQTDLMNLVHHVCKEAPGLESLFLISKSNCAFANFKDELTCVAAQQKLHDSKFQTVRLVSRLRKSTVEGASGVTAPTGPAASTNNVPVPIDQITLKTTPPDSDRSTPSAPESTPPRHSPEMEGSLKQDKFFILKSLTVEDLELSVRTGIWATQSHNEQSLNKAFKAADNVYLVFSANKSGEYFGYARMVSEIDEDPAAAIEFAPKAQATTELDLPKAIPTEATEHAPKGRIIDDSARGTIFWEADRGDTENESENESDNDTGSTKSGAAEDGTQTWGKPFKLEWLSTNRLPFYRTRGLRNPWNSNREVKIARDGTELEPSVGRRLLGLFNRIQSPVTLPASLRTPIAMVPGYVQMRPYGR